VNNKPAAENTVSGIENGALTGSRGPDRFCAGNENGTVRAGKGGAGRIFPLRMADTDGCGYLSIRRVAKPVEITGMNLRLKELLPEGKLNGVVRGVDA
jgi:hypothetical protein